MPKAKRAKVVRTEKTKKKGADLKNKLVAKI